MQQPAFPVVIPPIPATEHETSLELYIGLSARDYFAAAALIGLLASSRERYDGFEESVAHRAYVIADVMASMSDCNKDT